MKLCQLSFVLSITAAYMYNVPPVLFCGEDCGAECTHPENALEKSLIPLFTASHKIAACIRM